MRLRRIDLPGFGCLRDFDAEFAPGINVFYGLNEAGKSTLQQAICAMLYGFYEGERGKPDEKRRHDRFRPWDSSTDPQCPYRGSLEYEMDGGEVFEVRRDFQSGDIPTQLLDISLGSDVAAQFGRGRHGNVPFARRQLGMSRGVFQSCAFIAQGEIFQASQGAGPREIGDAIAAMADSARRDVSAAAALSRLDALILRIGTDRARTAELPKARENLREAEAELEAIDRARATIADRSTQLDATRERQAEVQAETIVLRAQYLLARSRSLAQRLDALREADASIERARSEREALRAYEAFPSHLRDRVVALDDRRAGTESRALAAKQEFEARSAEVTDADRLEYESLRSSVGSVSEETLRMIERAAHEPPPLPEPGLISRLASGIARVFGAIIRFVLRRPVVAADECVDHTTAMSAEEALALLERHRRYLLLRPMLDGLALAEQRIRQEQEALDAAEAALMEALDGRTVADFMEGCEKRASFDTASTACREAEKRREALLGGRAVEDIEAQLTETDTRLQALLTNHPDLEPGDSGESTSALDERLKALERKQHELEVTAARLDQEVQSAVGDQRARADVEEDVARWQSEAERLEKRRDSARMAREVIDEAMTAVYRDFAPAVSSFLSDGFAHVTEGRYQRAHVDPKTLEVSLLVPETHQVIKDPPVSQGTRALAYILMRIGLAQHMSAVGEPVPLVLDDPFVDLDEHRLGLTLEFILHLSERMQVLLFTKDPTVVRWFEANAPGEAHRLHELSRLNEPAAVV